MYATKSVFENMRTQRSQSWQLGNVKSNPLTDKKIRFEIKGVGEGTKQWPKISGKKLETGELLNRQVADKDPDITKEFEKIKSKKGLFSNN